MLNRSRSQLRYVNGFSIGSKHQKHANYAPVPFLYRVAGRNGPGPTLMKYWWTLGCLPNGIEVPFRLDEFHQSYIREHVPEELEHWLRAVVTQPVEAISDGLGEFMQKLQSAPLPRQEVFQRSQLVGEAVKIHAPLQRVFDQFGIEIPVIAVRAAASSAMVKEDLLDAAFAFREAVTVYGSTPHRRWAAMSVPTSLPSPSVMFIEQEQHRPPQLLDVSATSSSPSSSSSSTDLLATSTGGARGVSERELFIAKTIASVINIPSRRVQGNNNNSNNDRDAEEEIPVAAPDERLAAKVLTTLAEGCHRGSQRPSGSNPAAIQLLEAALRFAQNDPDVASATHTNLASAHTARGNFDQAQFHAREALLVSRSGSGATDANGMPQLQQQRRKSSNPRAHAALAVATALRDDIDSALDISASALQETPDSEVLRQVHEQIARTAMGRVGVKDVARHRRFHLQAQCERAMLHRGGRFFGDDVNEATTDNGTIIDSRLSRTEARLGHAIAFAGPGAGPINHSNMEETR